MSIKQNGGVFGRNPTFNDVTIEGDLIINGEVFTGLDFQGSWNASTNTPALASSTGTNGEFYIVSVAGTTDLNGITNWGIGDWAIFNGTAWQRVEGGADGNFNDVTVAGSLSLGDNVKANFGAGDDLQIYHDGNNSYIAETGAGDLNISGGNDLRLRTPDGENGVKVRQNGEVQLYHDGSEKLETTSTGIDVTGTATMDGLTVTKAAGDIATLEGTGTTSDVEANLVFNPVYDVNARIVSARDGSGLLSRLSFQTGSDNSGNTTEGLRIDGSQNVSIPNGSVGIGTSSPAAPLSIAGSSTGEYDALILRNSNSAASGQSTAIVFEASAGTSGNEAASVAKISGLRTGSGSKGDLLFHTTLAGSSSEAMRIDSSGNLLVGQSAIETNTVGHILLPNGSAYHIRNGGTAGIFNRKTSDGQIVGFQKDGTAVGSIGTVGGDTYFEHGGTGIRIWDGNLAITPCGTAGATVDGTRNLGVSSARWKDLYLGGGVYLGGTGTANKLDDYESGTWTPTAQLYSGTMTVNSATYTKIGNLVTLKASVTFDATTDSSGVSIQSIPFAHTGANKGNGGFVTASTVASASKIDGVGSGTFSLKDASGSAVTYTTMASTTLDFCISYTTTS